jgi:uncharacterized protein (TIGR00730 family)
VRICVFCGASTGRDEIYVRAAREAGAALARRGIGIVYGGGRIGMMGQVADAALAAGGSVIGVIPRDLDEREIGHGGLTELHVVDSMHERKALMAHLSDAFLALPGGFGTLEEFCEAVTWTQLGIHDKPCGLLNVEGYFDPLIAMFDHCVATGFVSPQTRAIVRAASGVEAVIDALTAPLAVPGRPRLSEEQI